MCWKESSFGGGWVDDHFGSDNSSAKRNGIGTELQTVIVSAERGDGCSFGS